MNKNYIIRLERESDYSIVENLTREAFWNVYQPGCTEHYVLHCYRSNPDFIPELDFVMELDGEIIGHVMFSRAEIIADDGSHIPIITFGPISIAPAFKRQGYGITLLKYALSRAKEMNFGAVFMEGNIDFYKNAGFVLASSLHIHYHAEPRESDVPYFLGLELKDDYLSGIEGTYHTPKGYYVAFDNPAGFSDYESTFPQKEKLVLPGQLGMEEPVLNAHNKDEYQPAHTAEHLLNQTMVRMFGCPRSRNAHIERKKSKCDYFLAECPSDAQVAEIEAKINALIVADLPVTIEFMPKEEAASIVDLSKLPNDASDTLRIVRIGDYDVCACIGAHVSNTSEIGEFKIISHDFNDGVWRVRWKVSPMK